MIDVLAHFFSTFQPKDWVTFSIALAAATIAGTQAIRGHLNHHQLLLREQADFSAQWATPVGPGQNVTTLIVTNVGNARAYNIQMSLDFDPRRLLGLATTAAGPLEIGQSLKGEISRNANMLGAKGAPEGEGPVWVILHWTDQTGVRRKQRIRNSMIPDFGGINSGEETNSMTGHKEKLSYYMGPRIGATDHFDPKLSLHGLVWKRRERRIPPSA